MNSFVTDPNSSPTQRIDSVCENDGEITNQMLSGDHYTQGNESFHNSLSDDSSAAFDYNHLETEDFEVPLGAPLSKVGPEKIRAVSKQGHSLKDPKHHDSRKDLLPGRDVEFPFPCKSGCLDEQPNTTKESCTEQHYLEQEPLAASRRKKQTTISRRRSSSPSLSGFQDAGDDLVEDSLHLSRARLPRRIQRQRRRAQMDDAKNIMADKMQHKENEVSDTKGDEDDGEEWAE